MTSREGLAGQAGRGRGSGPRAGLAEVSPGAEAAAAPWGLGKEAPGDSARAGLEKDPGVPALPTAHFTGVETEPDEPGAQPEGSACARGQGLQCAGGQAARVPLRLCRVSG